jgi:hypothetical protein
MSAPQIFISYSHEDAPWVRKFAEALRRQNLNVWLDEWRIAAGDSVANALETALRDSDAIVAVVSPSNARSPNVYFELGVALGMGKRLIPIVSPDLDRSAIPFDLRLRRFLTRGSPEEAAREVAKAVKGHNGAIEEEETKPE